MDDHESRPRLGTRGPANHTADQFGRVTTGSKKRVGNRKESRNKRVQHALASIPKKRFPDVRENPKLIKCQVACDATANGGQKPSRKTMPKGGRICVV